MHVETVSISLKDDVLVEQCQQGDSVAMERLILKYQDRIHNVIRKMCANADDAAELTQETFVKVIESIDKFKGRSSFYTWLFRIAVNVTLNHCQRCAKVGFRSLETEEPEPAGTARQVLRDFLSDDSSPDPVRVALANELSELAQKALTRLDDAQRAVVVLRDIEGMSYVGIAKVLDIELGTVRSRLSRARGNLRRLLEAMLQ